MTLFFVVLGDAATMATHSKNNTTEIPLRNRAERFLFIEYYDEHVFQVGRVEFKEFKNDEWIARKTQIAEGSQENLPREPQ